MEKFEDVKNQTIRKILQNMSIPYCNCDKCTYDKDRIPKRNDDIYLEIESFQEYEFTQCITYEMAIRNKNNTNEVEKVIKWYLKNEVIFEKIKNDKEYRDRLYKKEYDDLSKDEKGFVDYYLKNYNDVHSFEHCFDMELSRMVNNLEIIPFIDSHNTEYVNGTIINNQRVYNEEIYYFLDNFLYYRDKRLNKKIYKIIDSKLLGGRDHEQRGILHEELKIRYEEYVNFMGVSLEKRDIREGYILDTSIKRISELTNNTIETPRQFIDDYKKNANTNFRNIEDSESDFEEIEYEYGHTIINNFKRPKLKLINSKTSTNLKIEIDLNTPLNEVIAYVKHLKKDLTKDNILKAPIELLGVAVSMDQKNNNKLPNKSERYADMFFIYDCKKRGISNSKISNEIYNYYADKGITTKTMDAKTIKKYYEIAIEYIDNRRYTELITGIDKKEFWTE
ncbi:MAG: hypothetical protein ACK5LP_00945 [Campylobacteraceae bacterium]